MYTKIITLVAMAALLVGGSLFYHQSYKNFQAVPYVDLKSYQGRWFEVQRTLVSEAIGENPNSVCIVADYKAVNSTVIQVRNAQRQKTATGEYREINGVAYIINPATNAELQVDFFNKGNTGKANYYVLALGPVNEETDEYDWALVGEPLKLFGWVLVRDVKRYNDLYIDDVKEALKQQGYTKIYNTPIVTKQVPDCAFPDPL